MAVLTLGPSAVRKVMKSFTLSAWPPVARNIGSDTGESRLPPLPGNRGRDVPSEPREQKHFRQCLV